MRVDPIRAAWEALNPGRPFPHPLRREVFGPNVGQPQPQREILPHQKPQTAPAQTAWHR